MHKMKNSKTAALLLIAIMAFPYSDAISAIRCVNLVQRSSVNEASLQTLQAIQKLTSQYDAARLTVGERNFEQHNGISTMKITFVPHPRAKQNQEVPHISELQIEQSLAQNPRKLIRSENIVLRMNGQEFSLVLDREWAPLPPTGASDRYSNSHYQGEIRLPDGKRLLVQVQMLLDMTPEVRNGNQGRGGLDLFVSAIKE